MTGRCRQLAGIDDRAQALEPETIGGTVPAVPALPSHVHERRRVAIELDRADAAPEVIGPVALGNVTASAGLRAAAGEAAIEEEEGAKLDRVRLSGNAIGRVMRHRCWPRSVGQDDLDFPVTEPRLGGDTLLGRADQGRQRHEHGADGGDRDARHGEAGTTSP